MVSSCPVKPTPSTNVPLMVAAMSLMTWVYCCPGERATTRNLRQIAIGNEIVPPLDFETGVHGER